jgi:hypothetical protein
MNHEVYASIISKGTISQISHSIWFESSDKNFIVRSKNRDNFASSMTVVLVIGNLVLIHVGMIIE